MTQLLPARAPSRRGVIVGSLVALAVLGALILSGCGGGGSKVSDATSRSSSTPRTTASSSPASNARGLRAALIGLDDLSPGWEKGPAVVPGLQCGSFDPLGSAAKVVAGSFTRGFSYLQETVGQFDDEDAARRAYRGLVGRDGDRCMRRSMRAFIPQAMSSVTAPPVRLGRDDPLGAQRRAARYTMGIQSEFGTGDAYIVVISARSGRTVASLTSITSLEPLVEEAYEQLEDLVAEHLEQTTQG